jgi:putative transposase
MAHTYTYLLYHIVFSTKGRIPCLEADLRPDLFAYMGGIVRELRGKAYIVGGTNDHAHVLMTLPPTIGIAEAMRVIKANSSGWVHDKWPSRGAFAWQTGYGAFTVSQSNSRSVAGYIADQEEHHRRRSFQEEFLALLKKHGVEYDERYLWD